MSSLKVEVEAKVSPTAKVEQPIPILANSIPIGGSKGQVLTKKSGKPYDVAWENPKGGEGGGDIIVEGVTEERVEEIVSEKTADLQPKTDESLETESKEIVGAINELHNREDKQGLTEEEVKEIVQKTLPDWAEQEEKPTYTYEEITEKPDLVEDIGSSLAEETNVLTIELKDKSGKVIATTQVTIPKSEVPDLSVYVKTEDRNEFVKGGVTENSLPLTDEEKTSACDWLGAIPKPSNYETVILDSIVARKYDGTLVMARVDAGNGLALLANGNLIVSACSKGQIDSRTEKPLSGDSVDYIVQQGLSNCKIEWTDEQKAAARALLGIE